MEESALVGLKSFLLNPVDGCVRVWSQRNTTFQQEHIVGTTALVEEVLVFGDAFL